MKPWSCLSCGELNTGGLCRACGKAAPVGVEPGTSPGSYNEILFGAMPSHGDPQATQTPIGARLLILLFILAALALPVWLLLTLSLP